MKKILGMIFMVTMLNSFIFANGLLAPIGVANLSGNLGMTYPLSTIEIQALIRMMWINNVDDTNIMNFTLDDKILVCGLMNGKIELWNMDENSKEFGRKFLTSSTFENDFSNTLITNTKGLDTIFNKTIKQWPPKEEYYTIKEFLVWNGAKE